MTTTISSLRPPSASADKWLRMFADDVRVWKRCSLAELTDIFDGLTNIGEALNGVYNRPRVDAGSPAGRWLETTLEDIDNQRQALIEHVRQRAPVDHEDYEALCKMLIEWEGQCEGNPLHTKALIEQLIAIAPQEGGEA